MVLLQSFSKNELCQWVTLSDLHWKKKGKVPWQCGSLAMDESGGPILD
jgi:hypothetical protein